MAAGSVQRRRLRRDHHDHAPLPTAVCGGVLLCAAIAYTVLARRIIAFQGPHSRRREMTGHDVKGSISIALYLAAIPLAFVHRLISDALYITVALMWLVPDRRIESRLSRRPAGLPSASPRA